MPGVRVFPYYVILSKLIKMHLMEKHPKGEELCYMFGGNNRRWPDFEDPHVFLEGLPYLSMFPR